MSNGKGKGGGKPRGKKDGIVDKQLERFSTYVMGVAALLGGSKARQYKSCIFGTKGSRPMPGHIARCNRMFFGSSIVAPGQHRGGGGGRVGGAHSSAGGGTVKIAGAGPGQGSSSAKGPGKRREREGR